MNVHNVSLLVSLWVTLLADDPSTKPGDIPNKVYNKFLTELALDLFKVIAEYSALANDLARLQVHGEEGVSITPLFDRFKRTPIFRCYQKWVDTRDPELFQYLQSFLNFGSKLYYEEDSLNAVAFHDWQVVEDHLESLVLPSTLTKVVAHVVATIFEGWSQGPFYLNMVMEGSRREEFRVLIERTPISPQTPESLTFMVVMRSRLRPHHSSPNQVWYAGSALLAWTRQD